MLESIFKITDLEKYLGKVIVCYYYMDYDKEYNDPEYQRPYDENEIGYMWMFRLIDYRENNNQRAKIYHNIRECTLYGEYSVRLIDRMNGDDAELACFMEEKSCSDAQAYIRTPTKEEMKIYNKYKNKARYEKFFKENIHNSRTNKKRNH